MSPLCAVILSEVEGCVAITLRHSKSEKRMHWQMACAAVPLLARQCVRNKEGLGEVKTKKTIN